MMSKIYEIFGNDAHDMTITLLERAGAAGMVPEGAAIALKPNLVVEGRPEEGCTTHPGVLSGCIEYFQAHGFSDICVMESAWVGSNTRKAMQVCGYDRVCEKYHVPFYDLKKDRTRSVSTPFRDMSVCERALNTGFLIDLPVLKGHCQTVMTCALKNMKGCIPDQEKRRFHAEGLFKPIAALSAVLSPSLIIVDSICGDLNFEEGGNPVQTNRMYLGTDPVQIDAYGCQLMGLSVEDVPYIRLAEKYGAGCAAVGAGDLVRLNEPAAETAYPKTSGIVRQLTKNVHEDSACSACYASLVRALYIAKDEGISLRGREIYIGQGYQNTSPEGIGIGRCCCGASDCIMGCPPTAKDIVEHFKNI